MEKPSPLPSMEFLALWAGSFSPFRSKLWTRQPVFSHFLTCPSLMP